MVVLSLIYLYIGYKSKNKGVLVGGIIYIIGAYTVYSLQNILPFFICFAVALFLNKNPKHD